ncbi:MAG: S41 family peptidase [Bacteroidetes bacterium]|nr:S41 family peptidase [Bacteroidota bacterium]MCB9318112.1 S41 family peptidase [Lewinellaceae bacterium]
MKQILTLTLLLIGILTFGQSQSVSIDKKEKEQVIDSLSILLSNYYIFPEKIPPTISLLKVNYKKGVYDKINDPNEFADKLTFDVISITNDKHFRIAFDPETVDEERKYKANSSASTSEKDRTTNFGFDQVKILNGNIGYINLKGFYDLSYSSAPLNAAMNFVANSDALIIDLRNNHGGASDLGPYFSAFFFKEPQLLYDFYSRENNKTIHQQYWTQTYVDGKRLIDIPIFILTSNFTFSAAEAFAYSLQSLNKATIVGENSGGGAHMWTGKIVTNNFYAHIPFARPVDPRTKTNWEITGVNPDVKCDANQALVNAQIEALKVLMAKDSANSSNYQWHIDGLKPQLTELKIDSEKLNTYVGDYGSIKILFNNNKLYFDWRGTKSEMIPLATNYFMTNEFNFFRIKIVEQDGKVVALKIINDNSTEREFAKTK